MGDEEIDGEPLSSLRDFCVAQPDGPDPESCWDPSTLSWGQHLLLQDCRRGRAWPSCVGGRARDGLAQEAGSQAHAQGALTKAVLVEVAAAAGVLKVWIGLLSADLEEAVSYEGGAADDPHGLPLFPHASMLAALVQEHFAFHSAESGAGLG